MGTYADAERLTDYFSELKIGLTPLVTYARYDWLDEIVHRFPLKRILIETDTPYFLPSIVSASRAIFFLYQKRKYSIGY